MNVAVAKYDFELLGTIKDVDPIAGEFKKHKTCYKSYTRTSPSKVTNLRTKRVILKLCAVELIVKLSGRGSRFIWTLC